MSRLIAVIGLALVVSSCASSTRLSGNDAFWGKVSTGMRDQARK